MQNSLWQNLGSQTQGSSLVLQFYHSILCYGSHVWHHRAKVNSVKLKLEHVQRMVLMGITGVMKSTPTRSIETLLSILPIDLYIEQEAMATTIRLKNVLSRFNLELL